MYKLRITNPQGQSQLLSPTATEAQLKISGPNSIELINAQTQLGIKRVFMRRKSDNLELYLKENDQHYILILEDFYRYEGQRLLGKTASGQLIDYIPANGVAADVAQIFLPDQGALQTLPDYSPSLASNPLQAIDASPITPSFKHPAGSAFAMKHATTASDTAWFGEYSHPEMLIGAAGVLGIGALVLKHEDQRDKNAAPSATPAASLAKTDPANTTHDSPDAQAAAKSSVHKGDEVIDLSSAGLGKLIHPVQVNGHWLYPWDKDGDGQITAADQLNYRDAQSAIAQMQKVLTQLALKGTWLDRTSLAELTPWTDHDNGSTPSASPTQSYWSSSTAEDGQAYSFQLQPYHSQLSSQQSQHAVLLELG